MKILLIDPPFKRFTGFVNFYYPMGLAYLASVLRNAAYEVAILDVDALNKGSDIDFSDEYRRLEFYRQGLNNEEHEAWQDIKNVLRNFSPDIVGITAMTTKFGSVLKTAEVVKKYNPQLLVAVGGPHASLLPEQTLKSENIDIVVRGEGEVTLVELIRVLEGQVEFRAEGQDADLNYTEEFQLQKVKGLSDVKGISYRHNGQTINNLPRESIRDLDEIPFPGRDLLMHPKDYTSEDMGVVMTSRGCPFNCSYCCHPWGKRVRHRSADNVILEMEAIKQTYGTRQFEFKDDTFTVNKNWVLEFCDRLISKKLKVNWGCTTRAELLDDDLLNMMKKAGCNVIKIGIETGSERILKETKKGISFDQIKEAARLLNKHGLFWSGYFMVGLPTETEEDIMKTFTFMKELNPYYAGLGIYNPFPNTELFNNGVQMGLLYPEVELAHFFSTNPKDYFFIEPKRRMVNLGNDEFNRLVSIMMDGFHKHNTRVGNVTRRAWARRKTYLSDFRMFFKDSKKAITWMGIKLKRQATELE